MSTVKYRKGRSKARRGRGAMAKLSKQVRANTAMLKQTVEPKQIYYAGSNAVSSGSTSHSEVLGGLSQGVADTGTGTSVSAGARIGNSINVKHISARILLDGYRYAADPNNPSVKTGGMHRVIIYNSPCGEALNATDILKDATTTIAAMRSSYNVDVAQGKMYDIWYDKLVFLSDAKPGCLLNFSKKWKNGKQVIFDNNNQYPSNFRPRMVVISHNCMPSGNTLNFNELQIFIFTFKIII